MELITVLPFLFALIAMIFTFIHFYMKETFHRALSASVVVIFTLASVNVGMYEAVKLLSCAG